MKIKAVVWKNEHFSHNKFDDLNSFLDDCKQTDIFVDSTDTRSIENIVGTVDEAVYNPNDGIVIYATVVDPDVSELITKGLISVAPKTFTENNSVVGIHSFFFTPYPSEEVGDIEVIQSTDL